MISSARRSCASDTALSVGSSSLGGVGGGGPKVKKVCQKSGVTCHEAGGSGARCSITAFIRVVAIKRLSWVVCFRAVLHVQACADSKRCVVRPERPIFAFSAGRA